MIMDGQSNLKQPTNVDQILIELNEVRNQINHVGNIRNDNVPEFSKRFLLEDLKQYENYLKMKLARETDNSNFGTN